MKYLILIISLISPNLWAAQAQKTIYTVGFPTATFIYSGDVIVSTSISNVHTRILSTGTVRTNEIVATNGYLGSLSVSGFTSLGAGNSQIKMKISTGTTSSSDGGTVTTPHGLTGDKIVGLMGVVRDSANNGVADGSTGNAVGYQYGVYYNATDIQLTLHPTDCGNIKSKPFVVMVWYIE